MSLLSVPNCMLKSIAALENVTNLAWLDAISSAVGCGAKYYLEYA